MNYKNYSNIFVFDSGKKGETISIFGGIHGNETAGIKTIEKLKEDLISGKIKILKGKIVLALGNEKAIKLGKREYKYNLNRIFKKEFLEKKSSDYEIKRAKILAEIMKKSDILLDIHSTSSKSREFIFAENFKNELEIVKKLGISKVIIGREKISGTLLSGDTNSYMHNLGKIAFTLECGIHNDEKTFKIGYNSSLNLLKYFNFVEEKETFETKNQDLIEMYKIETTKTGRFIFKKGIDNFSEIKIGDLIGTDGEEKIFAKENFIILLPNYGISKPGKEIFYYGKKI